MTEQEIILTSIFKCRRVDLYASPQEWTPQQKEMYDYILSQRAKGVPLQYILKSWEFMGLSFFVDHRALIPRPETENLVEKLLSIIKDRDSLAIDILDIGTGTGNIAISLAKFVPKAIVTAVDLSLDALDLAKANARLHGVSDRVSFIHQEMGEFMRESLARGNFYDMIVSNPPYIPTKAISALPAEVQEEPRIALEGGEDGLEYVRTVVLMGFPLLRSGGVLAVEFGDGQRAVIEEFVARFLAETGEYVFGRDDYHLDRILIVKKK